ncbi:MAG: AAA family ATPase [bacterium]|nr:AAA family ATPase [bacterium]
MRLKKLKIEGYRSLKSVEWEPASLNVLIGPNASGKSNLLQALSLLPAAAKGTLYDEVLRRGGMVPLLWNHEATDIRLGVQCVTDDVDSIGYSLQLRRAGGTGTFEIVSEELSDADGEVLLTRTWADMAEAMSPRGDGSLEQFRPAGKASCIWFPALRSIAGHLP